MLVSLLLLSALCAPTFGFGYVPDYDGSTPVTIRNTNPTEIDASGMSEADRQLRLNCKSPDDPSVMMEMMMDPSSGDGVVHLPEMGPSSRDGVIDCGQFSGTLLQQCLDAMADLGLDPSSGDAGLPPLPPSPGAGCPPVQGMGLSPSDTCPGLPLCVPGVDYLVLLDPNLPSLSQAEQDFIDTIKGLYDDVPSDCPGNVPPSSCDDWRGSLKKEVGAVRRSQWVGNCITTLEMCLNHACGTGAMATCRGWCFGGDKDATFTCDEDKCVCTSVLATPGNSPECSSCYSLVGPQRPYKGMPPCYSNNGLTELQAYSTPEPTEDGWKEGCLSIPGPHPGEQWPPAWVIANRNKV